MSRTDEDVEVQDLATRIVGALFIDEGAPLEDAYIPREKKLRLHGVVESVLRDAFARANQ